MRRLLENAHYHQGFLSSAIESVARIKRMLTRHGKVAVEDAYPIAFAGHSKGGPEITIMATLLVLAGFKIKSKVTIGAPRSMDPFGAKLNRLLGISNKSVRVRFGDDPVTDLPPRSMGFVHDGFEICILPYDGYRRTYGRTGTEKLLQRFEDQHWTEQIKNHSSAGYRAWSVQNRDNYQLFSPYYRPGEPEVTLPGDLDLNRNSRGEPIDEELDAADTTRLQLFAKQSRIDLRGRGGLGEQAAIDFLKIYVRAVSKGDDWMFSGPLTLSEAQTLYDLFDQTYAELARSHPDEAERYATAVAQVTVPILERAALSALKQHNEVGAHALDRLIELQARILRIAPKRVLTEHVAKAEAKVASAAGSDNRPKRVGAEALKALLAALKHRDSGVRRR